MVVVPLVAMLAVIVSNPDRVARKTVFSAGAIVFVVLLVAPFYGAYRSSKFTGQEILSDPSVRDVLADKVELTDMFQVYGGAPQFLGFFLEMGRWGTNPQWGKVLASSALAPLPILGKPFREASGTAIYNRLIYGQLDVQDQIAPFQGEAFLDFHLAGVLVGFSFLGYPFKLQSAFAKSSSFFEIFVWQYFSVWTFFLDSEACLSLVRPSFISAGLFICISSVDVYARVGLDTSPADRRLLMRILHTAGTYAPSLDGVAEIVRNISERLVKRGHEVHVATSALPSESPYAELCGVHVHRFSARGNLALGMYGEI